MNSYIYHFYNFAFFIIFKPLSLKIRTLRRERTFWSMKNRRGYTCASEGTAIRVSPFEKWECITSTPSLRVLGEIDVGGSADSTGVWIWTLLPRQKRLRERPRSAMEKRAPRSRQGIPKQRAAMLVQRWTICKSVAGRGHDVATSPSSFGLPSQTFATAATTSLTTSPKSLEDV